MTTLNCYFTEVTLLITHYNRSHALQRLLTKFDQLKCGFGEIIVSDDGSRDEHRAVLKALQKKHAFRLITSDINHGLGHNLNKGQAAVHTPYTLYVQEDFMPKLSFVPCFKVALGLMDHDGTIDTIRFYAYFAYPYVRPYTNGFSELCFNPKLWYMNHLKFYAYSDHPHLRRHTFSTKFGRYIEGEHSDKTEFEMCLSFLKNGGKGLIVNEFADFFDHYNTDSELSTATFRVGWTYNHPVYHYLRKVYLVYRIFKNTLQLALYPLKNHR